MKQIHYQYTGRAVFKSPLEKKVFREFLAWGYSPEANFKEGIFEIDIAFPKIHLGIEIDGKDYHSSDEQRSRDKFRQSILEKKGWKIERADGWFAYKHTGVFTAEILLKYFTNELDEVDQRRCTAILGRYFRDIDPDLSEKLLRKALP